MSSAATSESPAHRVSVSPTQLRTPSPQSSAPTIQTSPVAIRDEVQANILAFWAYLYVFTFDLPTPSTASKTGVWAVNEDVVFLKNMQGGSWIWDDQGFSKRSNSAAIHIAQNCPVLLDIVYTSNHGPRRVDADVIKYNLNKYVLNEYGELNPSSRLCVVADILQAAHDTANAYAQVWGHGDEFTNILTPYLAKHCEEWLRTAPAHDDCTFVLLPMKEIRQKRTSQLGQDRMSPPRRSSLHKGPSVEKRKFVFKA